MAITIRTPHNHSGFSLVESAIVLAMVGLLMGSIWSASSYVRQLQTANQMVGDMAYVVMRIQRAVGSHNAGTILVSDASTAISQFFPAGYQQNNGYIYHPNLPGAWTVRVSEDTASMALVYVHDPDFTNSNPTKSARSAMPTAMCNRFLWQAFEIMWKAHRKDTAGTYAILTNSTSVGFTMMQTGNPFADANSTVRTSMRTACSRGFLAWSGPSQLYIE